MTLTTNLSHPQVPTKSEIVSLNGTNLYYEVYGKGDPLFFLHGYTQSSQSWLPFVQDFADEYEVYLVDLKGHGKSSWFTGPISIKSVANELGALIEYLKLKSINVIGFSYGGEVSFQLALLKPGLIKSMISIGSCGTWRAKNFPKWVEYLSYKNIENLPWMRKLHTSEEQIKTILDQFDTYDIFVSGDELKKIETRTLMVIGDQDDSLLWDWIISAKQNLPHSSLWIVPNIGHSAHMDKNKQDFILKSKEFFRGDISN